MFRQDYARVGLLTWVIVVLSAILPLAVAFRLWLEAARALRPREERWRGETASP
jgi:hypothetical protein